MFCLSIFRVPAFLSNNLVSSPSLLCIAKNFCASRVFFCCFFLSFCSVLCVCLCHMCSVVTSQLLLSLPSTPLDCTHGCPSLYGGVPQLRHGKTTSPVRSSNVSETSLDITRHWWTLCPLGCPHTHHKTPSTVSHLPVFFLASVSLYVRLERQELLWCPWRGQASRPREQHPEPR